MTEFRKQKKGDVVLEFPPLVDAIHRHIIYLSVSLFTHQVGRDM